MIALGMDTSNYATSVAVVNTGRMEVVCAKKVFLQVPQGQCGLRQSEAVFQHTKTLPELMAELRDEGALQGVGALGVSAKPRPVTGSYMPCFLAGLSAAVAAGSLAGVPVFQTSHQQGHVAAALFAAGFWKAFGNTEKKSESNHTMVRASEAPQAQEHLLLHFSGGTTELLWAQGYQNLRLLGRSLDLYAGQAIDRLGVSLGFDFPAGASLSHLAEACEEPIRPKTSLKGLDCHLSGLQNQCEALLAKGQAPDYVAKFCLLSVAHTALGMIRAARQIFGSLPVLCAGGVMASTVIRSELCAQENDVFFVSPEYASDNAVGVALIAGKEVDYGGSTGSFGTE